MSHPPIFPPGSEGSDSSSVFHSSELDAVKANKHDMDVAIPGASAVELPPELAQGASALLISKEVTSSTMSNTVLAEYCLSEINHYSDGELRSDTYCVELLRRATLQGNQDAWKVVQQCLRKIVRGWIDHHPEREVAYQLDSEENYVAEAFTRFYQATVERQIELDRLSVALQYLQACLDSAILDKLRALSRLRVFPLREPRSSEESVAADSKSREVWEMLRKMLPNAREQRLAYLLFHCALKPTEIVHLFPQEFHDVQEISRLRRTIIESLLDNMDQCERR